MTLTLKEGNITRAIAEISLEWENDGGKMNKTFGLMVGGNEENTFVTTTTSVAVTTEPMTHTLRRLNRMQRSEENDENNEEKSEEEKNEGNENERESNDDNVWDPSKGNRK